MKVEKLSDILFLKVNNLLNIKPEITKALKRIGIEKIRDLIFYSPYSFQEKILSPDLSLLKDGMLIQAEVTIRAIQGSPSIKGPVKIAVVNDTGSLQLVFFSKIPPFIFNRLIIGSKHIICGRVQFFEHRFQITHPEFILKKELASTSLEPIYPLTYGLSNKQLYLYILQAMQIFKEKIMTSVSNAYEKEYLAEIFKNLSDLHLYDFDSIRTSEISMIWASVRQELASRELFANQALLKFLRKLRKVRLGLGYGKARELQQSILNSLNFELTIGQQEVIEEIEKDQSIDSQMVRLLQGDVGSGKTLVALLTMLNAVEAKLQTVLMAPTDLLATQHHQFFLKSLKGQEISIALLTGKTSAKERRQIYEGTHNGEISILIGTHALFQGSVNFKNLGYIVIDEQHKFGVKQRLQLINKATHPDILIMTATPIPRSLTLTMFGDMESSRLKSKPATRLPIITKCASTAKTNEIIEHLSKIINCDEQIYWVCPLIDQSDNNINSEELNMCSDVNSRFNMINQQHPGLAGIVHGKMKNDEKEIMMERFRKGEIKILIATTVIEVGIDVPQATLIVIENAEKFGLSQLHQLRGRVGRGDKQSYCMMIYNSERLSVTGRKRLEIMKTSHDGFHIAEQDMLLRGSGEIMGTRQSGEPEFFFADLSSDLKLLEQANLQAAQTASNNFTDFQIKLFSRQNQDIAGSG